MQGGVACTFDLVSRAVEVQYEDARHDTDQYQHDQANAFLAIVGAVYKAHGHGRNDQYQTVPERRVLFVVHLAALFRGFVHLGTRTPPFKADQDQRGNHKACQGREYQRGADVDRLLPVHTLAHRNPGDQGIGQTHAQDRADQGVRA